MGLPLQQIHACMHAGRQARQFMAIRAHALVVFDHLAWMVTDRQAAAGGMHARRVPKRADLDYIVR